MHICKTFSHIAAKLYFSRLNKVQKYEVRATQHEVQHALQPVHLKNFNVTCL